MTLRQLHVQYCGIVGEEGGAALGEVLGNTKGALEQLNLTGNIHPCPVYVCMYMHVYILHCIGNRLGGLGLTAMCAGLAINKTLTHLELADNGIDSV